MCHVLPLKNCWLITPLYALSLNFPGIPACGDPGQPLNGYRLPDDRTTYSVGATLHFSCAEGFTLVGADILRCMNNGTWDHQRPLCEGNVNAFQIS